MTLIRTIAGRALSGVAVLLIVATATFFGSALLQWRPEVYLLSPSASPEAVAALHARLGIDKPLLAQFWTWLTSAVQGDLGRSWATSQPVGEMIAQRFPITMSIVVASLVLALLIGIPAGVMAGLLQGRPTDRIISIGLSLIQSIPEFWLAILLITFFALQLSFFPAIGYVPMTESFSGWARSLVLPCVALGLPISATFGRHVRSAMIGQLGQDYVRWSITAGFSRAFVSSRVVLTNALSTVVPVMALQVLALLGLSVVVENIFAIHGIGELVLGAAMSQDIPVLLAGVLVYGAIIVLVNLLADLGQAMLNPKMRISE